MRSRRTREFRGVHRPRYPGVEPPATGVRDRADAVEAERNVRSLATLASTAAAAVATYVSGRSEHDCCEVLDHLTECHPKTGFNVCFKRARIVNLQSEPM